MTTFRNKYRLDQTLYENALYIIKFGPVLMIIFLCWVFGNKIFISGNGYIEDYIDGVGEAGQEYQQGKRYSQIKPGIRVG